MGAQPTRVAIVVVADFADRLLDLARRRHVWIADTPPNHAAAERVGELIEGDWSQGVTTFRFDPELPPDAVVADLLPVVDEHHGLRSEWTSDVDLEVRGARCTALLRTALAALGSFELQDLPDGFTAQRRPAV